MNDPYRDAAEKYRPKDGTHILFIAEAPPNSVDRYFYFEEVKRNDWLWVALMKCLYPDWTTTKQERKNKRRWLTRFQGDRFQLIDAVKLPISGSKRERVATIAQCADELVQEIAAIKPAKVVLIKATVYEALFERLKGFPVANEGAIPFPSSGRQKEFCNGLSRLKLTDIFQ